MHAPGLPFDSRARIPRFRGNIRVNQRCVIQRGTALMGASGYTAVKAVSANACLNGAMSGAVCPSTL